jgi:hypothetical protein
MSNFFFNYTQVNNGNFSPTIPESSCNQGSPSPLNGGGEGYECSELLYSIWDSYQNTNLAKFTYNQAVTHAPTSPTMVGPKTIFIIRHGEKNSLPAYSINNNGIYRSCKLVDYVKNLAEKGYPISYIVTCNPCPFNTADPSNRPQQTIDLTAFMFSIPYFIYGGQQDFQLTVLPLFNSGIFDGLNILICWEHSAIQSLVLNILNEAGLHNRLPASVTTAQPNPDLYGDEFFKQFSEQYDLIPDGKYKCTLAKPNYNPIYDPNISSPIYVGSNSEYYPYWNNYCYNNVLTFYSDGPNNEYKCALFQQTIDTCYANCDLKIGLFQPLSSNCSSSPHYYNNTNPVVQENECKAPDDWVEP